MIFTTHWFLLFAVLAIGVYWAVPRGQWRLWYLGVVCVFFHTHFAGPAGVVPIVVLMAVTYFAGLSRNRVACALAIALCVAALVFYKYMVFLIGAAVQPLSPAFAATLAEGSRKLMPGLPPLAVSFFTFEFVHYLYDVRRGGEPLRSPIKFVLFSIFFPSLVAGPIKRYMQFVPELEQAASRTISSSDMAEGLRRIGLGFFKKVLLAENLTSWIELTQPEFSQLSLFGRWIFVAAVALRILFDFSGYSDIAIGCARCLGIRLPENFNWPYLASNLQQFWQRWHISLSSWIRDYVYIPLGGNRHGFARKLTNGLIAFGLCGLWHGPAWNFVLWGLFHGVGLAVANGYEKIPKIGPVLKVFFDRDVAPGWMLTQSYVGIGWLLFFYPVPEAWRMTKLLVGAT
jgi:alginate O-acetyltransferase complex protein AlgI